MPFLEADRMNPILSALLRRFASHSGAKGGYVAWADELRGVADIEAEMIFFVNTRGGERERAAVVCWLAELAGERHVPHFKAWLWHSCTHVRYEAAAALGCIGAAAAGAMSSLSRLRHDTDPEMARIAKHNLGRIVEAVAAAAGENLEECRRHAAGHSNPFERERYLRILSRADAGGSVETFHAALTDPHEAVRAQACDALALNGCAAHRSLKALRALAIDSAQPLRVRKAAAEAIDAADAFEKTGAC